MQTITYRRDNQQGPTVEHRELYSVSWETITEKNIKKNVYMCITDSLCCMAEINTTL